MRRSTDRGLLLATTALALAVPGVAQPPPPAGEAPGQPTFRAGTELVRVDVTVTARDGGPVTDLTQDDFLVFEDDRPQQIQSFQFLRRDGTPPPDDDASREIRSPEHARAEAARDEVRLFAIFLDDYHVSRGRNTLVVRDALTEWVRHALGPMDLVVLMDPLTPLDHLRFTRDRYTLLQAVQAFEGRRGIYVPARSLLEEQQQLSRDVRRVRMEVTLSALEALVTHLGALREGRKSVLFVSEGFSIPPDLMEDVRRVYDAANRGNTAIYTLDPRGLAPGPSPPGQDLLRVLADNTGGRAIVSYNRFAEPLAQMVRDASALYLLGYVSSQAPQDGRFHKIDVRVRRKGVEVRARKGYWAPSREEIARARTEAASGAPPEVTAALADLAAPRGGRPLAVWTGLSRGAPGRMHVTVSWELPGRTVDAARPPLHVAVRAARPDGQVVFEGRRRIALANGPQADSPGALSGQLTFETPPGRLTLTLTLETPEEVLGTVTRELAVTDLWRAPLALATPRVYRVRSAGELKALMANAEPAPAAAREFDRADRLLVALTVYHTGPVDVTATLLSRHGTGLARLPLLPAQLAGATSQLDLPLQRFAPGEYVVRIEARSGEDTATEHLAIRVR